MSANIVSPAEVVEGDTASHLVDRKLRPVSGDYTPHGPVVATRPVSATRYGVPGTYLTFEDGYEGGPFLPTDRFVLTNR